MSDFYNWETYDDVANEVRFIRSGLLAVGHQRGTNLAIFAETRSEWLKTALACFHYGFPGKLEISEPKYVLNFLNFKITAISASKFYSSD